MFAIRIDCSESRSVKEAFEGVLSLGFVEVLVYNAHQPMCRQYPTNFADIRVDSFEKSLFVSSVGAFHCAQYVLNLPSSSVKLYLRPLNHFFFLSFSKQVLPGMVERGRGTILFTGCSASRNGIAGYSELCKNSFPLLIVI